VLEIERVGLAMFFSGYGGCVVYDWELPKCIARSFPLVLEIEMGAMFLVASPAASCTTWSSQNALREASLTG